MPIDVEYGCSLAEVDWDALMATLSADRFDNGRTVDQLRVSFENSFACVIARKGGRIVGTARALSDGVCNAYVVDVWTLSEHRRQGIGRHMMEILMERLDGQHVHLFSDDCVEFYKRLGFREQPVSLSLVAGTWLRPRG